MTDDTLHCWTEGKTIERIATLFQSWNPRDTGIAEQYWYVGEMLTILGTRFCYTDVDFTEVDWTIAMNKQYIEPEHLVELVDKYECGCIAEANFYENAKCETVVELDCYNMVYYMENYIKKALAINITVEQRSILMRNMLKMLLFTDTNFKSLGYGKHDAS